MKSTSRQSSKLFSSYPNNSGVKGSSSQLLAIEARQSLSVVGLFRQGNTDRYDMVIGKDRVTPTPAGVRTLCTVALTFNDLMALYEKIKTIFGPEFPYPLEDVGEI